MSSVTILVLNIVLAIVMVSASLSAFVTLSRQSNNFKIGLVCVTLLVWIPIGFYETPNANIIEKRNLEKVTVYHEKMQTPYEEPIQIDFTYRGERFGVFMEGSKISVGEYKDVSYKVWKGQTNEIQFAYSGMRNDILGIKPEVYAIIIYDDLKVNKILLDGGK